MIFRFVTLFEQISDFLC